MRTVSKEFAAIIADKWDPKYTPKENTMSEVLQKAKRYDLLMAVALKEQVYPELEERMLDTETQQDVEEVMDWFIEKQEDEECVRWEDTITVSTDAFEEALEDQKFLRALMAAGVDNWEGYEEAQSIAEGWS